MSNAYKIESSKPSLSSCDCCGGTTVRLTRFVYRDEDAFAVYYAAYSNNHPGDGVAMLISLGEWGGDSEPSQRCAFYCRVRPTDDAYEVMLGDAGASPWAATEIVGRKLSRDEALSHRWKSIAFGVLDEAFVLDASLRGFLQRKQCGDLAVPLEHSFKLPDDVFALGEERVERTRISRNFVSLDDKRFYVRCLLPVPVELYQTWTVGLWIEVSQEDYEGVWHAWDDPDAWSRLCFNGTLANDATSLELPVRAGTAVRIHAPDPNTPPQVASTANPALNSLLTNTWRKDAFEEYAVSRGFL